VVPDALNAAMISSSFRPFPLRNFSFSELGLAITRGFCKNFTAVAI